MLVEGDGHAGKDMGARVARLALSCGSKEWHGWGMLGT